MQICVIENKFDFKVTESSRILCQATTLTPNFVPLPLSKYFKMAIVGAEDTQLPSSYF